MNQADSPPSSPTTPGASPCIVPLTVEMLPKLIPIETACHDHPWTTGNFTDAIKAGNQAIALLEYSDGPIIGYYVAMRGYEEVHLLNITVAPQYQKQGCGHLLLETLRLWTVAQHIPWIWLEVRESNTRALYLYRRFGFNIVGMRKNYYPTLTDKREHAVLMSLRVC